MIYVLRQWNLFEYITEKDNILIINIIFVNIPCIKYFYQVFYDLSLQPCRLFWLLCFLFNYKYNNVIGIVLLIENISQNLRPLI